MRKLPDEYPDIHSEFMEGKPGFKTTNSSFYAVSPQMNIRTLEQQTKRSQETAGGIVGKKTDSYVSTQELVYDEILVISNCYSNIAKCKTPIG